MLTSDQALAQVNRLYARLADRRRDVDEFERYFRGEHPLVYATKEWAKAHAERFRGFADNWCGVVGSAPVKRTAVDGFRIGEDVQSLSDDERILWNDWQANEMPAQSSQGFLMSTIAKRSFVLVWGDDNDEPVVTWEHPAQAVVDHDPANRRLRRYGLKAWVEGDQEFATLYEPAGVWKWQRPVVNGRVVNGRTEAGLYVAGQVEGGWVPRQPPEDDIWPLDNPLGVVPLVEFANRPMLGGEPLSDIAGTKAMQDAINLLWAYLFTAADFASMPARVVMGQEPPKIPVLDENGQKIGERPVDVQELTRGRMLWLTGQNTKVDQWDAAKLDVFTNVVNVAVRHVAAQTSTPIYLIHGELGNVNGETLTGLDAPLVDKIRESHTFYTPRVRDVFSLMAMVRGNRRVAQACRTGVAQWRNPETRSDAQLADAALKDRQIGFPLQWIAEKRYGLSQTEVTRLMEMVAASASDPLTEKLLNLGNPGNVAGG